MHGLICHTCLHFVPFTFVMLSIWQCGTDMSSYRPYALELPLTFPLFCFICY